MTTRDTPEAEPQFSALDEVELAEKEQMTAHDTPEATTGGFCPHCGAGTDIHGRLAGCHRRANPPMTTRDTPEAALAAALREVLGIYCDRKGTHTHAGTCAAAIPAAILDALDDWTLVPSEELGEDRMTMDLMETAIRKDQAEIARLREALDDANRVLRVAERVCPDCGLTAARIGDIHINVQVARATLAPSEP